MKNDITAAAGIDMNQVVRYASNADISGIQRDVCAVPGTLGWRRCLPAKVDEPIDSADHDRATDDIAERDGNEVSDQEIAPR